jgi:hypothetical protein
MCLGHLGKHICFHLHPYLVVDFLFSPYVLCSFLLLPEELCLEKHQTGYHIIVTFLLFSFQIYFEFLIKIYIIKLSALCYIV